MKKSNQEEVEITSKPKRNTALAIYVGTVTMITVSYSILLSLSI